MQNTFSQTLEHSFINRLTNGSDLFKAKLLNNSSDDTQVLTYVDSYLKGAQTFDIAVAFVTKGGLSYLKTTFSDLADRGIKGRLLTSVYLDFNDPDALEELLKIKNLEVRLSKKKGFHAKGYFFHFSDYSNVIIGSSNLTETALKTNYEWNLRIRSDKQGDIYQLLKEAFDREWEESEVLNREYIRTYRTLRKPPIFPPRRGADEPSSIYVIRDAITPNQMQTEAMEALQKLRQKGENKAIIISATGSGKTYLTAFDVHSIKPKRMLFLAHREQVLHKSIKDYKKIIPELDGVKYGILAGNTRNSDATYLFSMVQTLSKDHHLEQFPPDYFDYIVIDEVHRSGAPSYQKILNYFQPKFLLGITATPERTDGFDIFELFDHNVAYEIRLHDALEMEIVAPFHYFGVSDYEIDGEVVTDVSDLRFLVKEERVNYLLEKIDYYGYCGHEGPKGLVFCSTVKEAEIMAEEFDKRGHPSVFLSGEHSQEERQEAIAKLESGKLQYIFVRDIFNEGIDIPCLNQVIMMRHTESSIIFVQQLGRGLRKHASKDYLVVIDFIGNYQNNFLIPIALADDNSLNKDNARRTVREPGFISGISHISFEEVAREQILKSIASSRLDDSRRIKEAYQYLKAKIARQPRLVDFITYNSIDPLVIVEKYASYNQFISRMERVPQESFGRYQDAVLQFIFKEFTNGKRLHEVLLIEKLLEKGNIAKKEYVELLKSKGLKADDKTLKSVERIFDYRFFVEGDVKKYGAVGPLKLEDDTYRLHDYIRKAVEPDQEYRQQIKDIIDVTTAKNKDYSSDSELTLFKKYSRKDVCRLLDWENDEKGTIYGYKLKHGTLPIFVTYDKAEDHNSQVHYGDELLDPNTIHWYTRANRTTQSREIRDILRSQEEDRADIHVFIKKNDDEGAYFYYLGTAKIDMESVTDVVVDVQKGDKAVDIVSMNLMLDNTIELSLFDYLKK